MTPQPPKPKVMPTIECLKCHRRVPWIEQCVHCGQAFPRPGVVHRSKAQSEILANKIVRKVMANDG